MNAQDMESRHPLVGARAPRRTLRFLSIFLSAAFLFGLVLFYVNGTGSGAGVDPTDHEFAWNNDTLAWERCGFHFRTLQNYMCDPSGPMYYKGLYHIFYQYGEGTPYWQNITWGHAVSRDLINWEHLPLAIWPEHPYDISGVWTGSIIVVSEKRVVMLFTAGDETRTQNINLAESADPSDPLLLNWIKDGNNPVLRRPPGIIFDDFRDPNPIWYNKNDSTYHIVVGSKNDSLQHTGIALVYKTKDFKNYTLLPNVLHSLDKVGMWECVEVYPVATAGSLIHTAIDIYDDDSIVLDRSTVKHVVKASMNDEWRDYYAIGTFDPIANTWTPDNAALDVGIGLRYDWGNFYASRTFFDPVKKRRILWGFVGESDSREADIKKGWASVYGTPRSVLYDVKTGTNVLTWPIEEVESLRMNEKNFSDIIPITVKKGSYFELPNIGDGNQLDIEVEFEIETTIEADVGYNCGSSGGAANRGLLGPFGLLVLANHDRTENTAAYFYISKRRDKKNLRTHFCQDETRSSKANDIVKRVVGNIVPVLDGEKFAVRILVDHSVVEGFAMGGRTCATSRAYPTEAINDASRVFLFNNATGVDVVATSVKIWHLNSTINEKYNSKNNGFYNF